MAMRTLVTFLFILLALIVFIVLMGMFNSEGNKFVTLFENIF